MIWEGIPGGAGDNLDNKHPMGGYRQLRQGVVSGVNIRKIEKGNGLVTIATLSQGKYGKYFSQSSYIDTHPLFPIYLDDLKSSLISLPVSEVSENSILQ